jgi:predicted DNA-binding transcriptional regulator AlpA
MPCEPPCIHPRDIIGNGQVRRLCATGSKPISRGTLIRWRAHNGFPPPIRTIPGPGSSSVELWDRRAVKAWLRARAAASGT